MNVKLLANLRLNSHHNPAIRRNLLRGFFDNLIFHPLRSFSRPSPTEPRCTLRKFVNVGVDNISANCVDCSIVRPIVEPGHKLGYSNTHFITFE